MSANADAVSNQGEFSARRPRDEPMETSGHQPGKLVTEADRAPEFHAQTLPAGSAPKESTYQPNPDLNNQGMYQKASETLQGASSSDVHTGLGHPGQGQTSNELRHDGMHGRKKQGLGQAGLSSHMPDSNKPVDPHQPEFANQRNLEEGVGGRSTGQGGDPAEDRVPESAERVAAEAPSGK